MEQIKRLLKFAVSEFGPMLAFYVVKSYSDLRTAILASLVVSVIEIALRLKSKKPFTHFFKFSVAVTLVFGALDLWVQTPIFFKYEAAITNFITAVYFGMTVRASRSFIQEWIEKKQGKPMEDANAILRARMLTIVWTAYFIIKSAFYFEVSRRYSLEEALAIRMAVGSISFYGLLATSILFGRPVLVFLQERGWLPTAAATAAK